jgi:hypothetical protein
MTGIVEFNASVPLTVVEILDVIVVFDLVVMLDTITVVVFEIMVVLEVMVALEPVVAFDVVVFPGAIVPFTVAFVAAVVAFMGIQVCLIISAPFSAIMVVGAFVLPLTM